ncbi:unnamed protein product [Saccharomyces cerevisiae]|nr:unnamed protein product [Saccharomyces cerevisiae]
MESLNAFSGATGGIAYCLTSDYDDFVGKINKDTVELESLCDPVEGKTALLPQHKPLWSVEQIRRWVIQSMAWRNVASYLQSNSSQEKTLKERFSEIYPIHAQDVRQFVKEHGKTKISDVLLEQVYGGMRGIPGSVWEGSVLDPEDGIRFRGRTIADIQKDLPKAKGSSQPLPEALFWLLLTGEVPTQAQVENLSADLMSRSELPSHVVQLLDNLPKDLHPMAQFSIAVTALESESKFAKAYAQGISKQDYWSYTFEDSLDLLGKLPVIAAKIYRNVFKDGKMGEVDPNADYAKNLVNLIGSKDEDFVDLMRLYLTIHSDHEGGNNGYLHLKKR